MSGSTLLSFTLLAVSTVVRADYFSKDPLVGKVVPYDQIPYQVMTDTDDPRGFQTGYNICNSTTENQDSLCQTMFVNHIDDFCLWAPGPPNSTIADTEGDVVAWCSKKGHGTRIIPDGAITGLQFIKTPSYIQIAGTINQAMLNIAGEYGGELDSGGQDGEGNPMGGLVYSNNFKSNNGNNASFQQAQHWSFFIGANQFCGKVCDSTGSNPQGLCQNIYDRLGCEYNAPNTASEGVFESCDGDDMTPVGTYVVDGQTSVYHQPAESVDIGVIPYTATPAPSSNCVPFTSAAIFTDAAGVTAASGASASASATPAPSGSGAGASGGSASGGGSAATKTSAKNSGSGTGSGAPAPTGSGGASAIGVSSGAIAIALFALFA
ncbi:hypothetical protein B0H17DRAFT_956080 [Mycena rosella]|uniref:Macrofage activating glycoprotein n=1 Tax=Mycena rosella TaxID=1033263 RepID=A0AAD7CQ52_MYCRO|nr:hypothetical protein B0H17DRAFT_956080 [Mycena rosella]